MSSNLFEQQLKQKILVIDGAMGTMLQQAELTVKDFGGEQFEGCNEQLNKTAPHVVKWIHEEYLKAGADMIETNTFGATSIVLEEYGIADQAYELNLIAAKYAKEAAEAFSTSDWPRFAAGSIGPTTKTLTVTGGTTFEALTNSYAEQAEGLIAGGVDLLLVETSQDTRNVKAAYLGIKQAFKKTGRRVPLLISGTIEPMGTMLAGQNIESFYLSIEHMQPAAVGLNCATGPEFMTDHLRSLAELSTTATLCYPNAGLPDEEGHYHETPDSLAKKVAAFAEKGWLNITGGCCGTSPAHIKAISEAVSAYEPRTIPASHPHAVSGIEPLIYEEDMRPLLVGERTNVIGSKKFKRLIAEGKYEEASEIARAQVKGGAHVIDICLADPDRDELKDMERFLQYVIHKVKVPLMIDSTDDQVIERALTYSQGKAIINSINLEDGEERFEKVAPLIRQFGAAVVVGTIDEEGMATTAKDKLRIAQRSYEWLVDKYGIPPQDILFDPLVFPVGTGDQQYLGAAKETVEGIRLIKETFPHCLTILGVSNVSFGLPSAGREVLNAVFLYECTLAGLDYAIVNTEKLERYASIPQEERTLAKSLLYENTEANLASFVSFYRGKKAKVKKKTTSLSLEERLAQNIVEGTKEGLIPDLDLALQKYENPLQIINGPLMDGMAEVGRLFNDNQLIVAEVLQSAEVMKTSVAYLEPHMDKASDKKHSKGKVLLATVKGDVHDIGKNLVEIILSNNGYEVVDLGIKVTPQELIQTIQKEEPDVVGLSGLLVKSAQQMVLTAQDLKEAKISIPILVGGAALSRKFTDQKISPQYEGIVQYAKDAMDGLSITNRIQKSEERQHLLREKQEKLQELSGVSVISETKTMTIPKRSNVAQDVPRYTPMDLKRHVLKDYPIAHIEPYINLQMLLGHHLGIKGKVARLLAEQDEKTLKLKALIDELLSEAKQKGLLSAHGVYRFFPAQSENQDVLIYDPEDHQRVLERFSFPRQDKEPHLCLADYLASTESGTMDYVGLFGVTAGKGIRERAIQSKNAGDYLRSHALQALALEVAEGFAERTHQLMRDRWGFPDSADVTMQDRFSAKYQGQRYSFGYPACPNLEDQAKLFRLLQPDDIGLTLTDGFMMEPEASVTAIVFAHPEARYFNVQQT